MHILVTSPIPSHPQNHGNRARVFSVCRALQERGYRVHFVYGGMEGLTPAQETAIRRTWDHTYVLSCTGTGKNGADRKKSPGEQHLIDDWYPDEMTALTDRIMQIWDIRMCLANYVWCSKWLEHVPAGIPRIIDTHDIFADRNARLDRDNIDAAWFSTSRAEEAKALARADTVLAIQDIEARHFRALGHTDVRVLGHLAAQQFDRDATKSAAIDGTAATRLQEERRARLSVGYLASDNPINQHSLALLAAAIQGDKALQKACAFRLAGGLSHTPAAQHAFFERLGFVDDAAAFHQSVDVIINPNIGGTGLKIKSIDALSYGAPLIATRDAMAGISTSEPFHQCTDVPDMCAKLIYLAQNRDTLPPLAAAGQSVFKAYRAQQEAALDGLFPAVKSLHTSGGARNV